MRRSVRVHAEIGPEERLATAIASLAPSAQRALVTIADREDLPLVAGVWGDDHGGCLVSNVVTALSPEATAVAADLETEQPQALTVDMRVLDLIPALSSRDLNTLIVAWDEAAMQESRRTDAALRRLLRGALARAGVPPTLEAWSAGQMTVARDQLVRTPPNVTSTCAVDPLRKTSIVT